MTADAWIELGVVVLTCIVTISGWSFWMGSKLSHIVTELQFLSSRVASDTHSLWNRIDNHGERLDQHGKILSQHSEAISGIRRTCDDRYRQGRTP